MKKIILFLIIVFSLQTWSKADDISDFQIEGMSIGDSLLSHISKKEINIAIKIIRKVCKYIK